MTDDMTDDTTGSDGGLTAAIEALTPVLADYASSNREVAAAMPSRTKARILEVVAFIAAAAAAGSLITALGIRSTQTQNRRTLDTDTQILQLVQGAVGPDATKANMAAQAHLIYCLDTLIQIDTGHGGNLAGCAVPGG